ncbi:hypothetical protein [Flavivirga aquimarina]|uniref:hypothetical protein n=1 Tax=Flavivirga aquimarina TaxID=2027862 RepID=UPI0026E0478D|nr:hypothetical protein [Flavivirga aquimarina]
MNSITKQNRLNCMLGIIWQSSMILLPIFFMMKDFYKALMALSVFIITSIILKYTWLDKTKYI